MEYKLELIESDEKYISGTLGIPDVRRKQLERLVEHAMIDCENVTDAPNIYLKHCKHFNEVYYCIFHNARMEIGRSFALNNF